MVEGGEVADADNAEVDADVAEPLLACDQGCSRANSVTYLDKESVKLGEG